MRCGKMYLTLTGKTAMQAEWLESENGQNGPCMNLIEGGNGLLQQRLLIT